MSEKSEKGRSLERAVWFIHDAILKSNPKFKGVEFTIETNVTVVVAGVRHEIDVLVKTLPGSLYESTWIFECKNWQAPVGKNDIIILAEKVNALRANRGFLVTRQLTKDAEAQLKLDSRLSFMQCTDDFLSPLNGLELIHSIYAPQTVNVMVKNRGVPATEHPKAMDWKIAMCRLNNKPVEFGPYVLQHVDQIIGYDRQEIATKYPMEGKYSGDQTMRIEFEVGEFQIDNADVEYMDLTVRFDVEIQRRKIISKFELKGHGRAFSFEPITDFLPGKQLTIDVVERF